MVKMLVVVLLCLSTLGPVPAIRLDGNGYTDILVVINPSVPENQEILNQIKEMIMSGSEYLFEALDHKVYFKEVKILVPSNWIAGTYDQARTESYSKGKIKIEEAHSAFGDEPFTQQHLGCGQEARFTHFTPNFLLNQDLIHVYGPKGRVFVHEWAHLRWGVFDEYDKKEPFYISGGQILPTRCTEKISGQWFEIFNQHVRPCQTNGAVPSPSCEFLPDVVQNTNASIMYMPSLDSITAFCDEKEHNFEAPNQQNKKCKKSTRSVILEDSVDRHALATLTPLQSPPPPTTFRVLQRGVRIVCLVLDVSGSMAGSKIIIQQQAASVLINELREGQYVGLVMFSSSAVELSRLTIIDGQATRDRLINMLPVTAGGSTYICNGLRKGLQVLRADDGEAIGDEIIFLTDGMATDNVNLCLEEAVNSGAIINTIAFGNSADGVLETMAKETEGRFLVTNSTFANQLVDAFSSMNVFDGNLLTQAVQLESNGQKIAGWFNGTVTIDRSVGNRTTFTITYESSAPSVWVQSPSGLVYDQRNTSDIASTITLTIPGTAEPGDWKYSFFSKGTVPQAISLIVSSQAAHEDVYPVTVTARTDQQTSDGQTPLLVMAEVSQNYNPVLGASVWANLSSDQGQSLTLELLDNGAGADAQKDDGIYSRYCTKLFKGKYSLRVKVEKQQTAGVRSVPYTHSGVLYVPGYIKDGQVELNPPKPAVNLQPVDVGNFTRTVTGDSFVMDKDISVNFPPNQITDLTAELQEDVVFLNWTAPGADLDEGNAEIYEIRWSENLKTLQNDFASANLLNASAMLPQVSGSAEHYAFQPTVTLKNGTTLFFAVQSQDQQKDKSDVSNIARVTKYIPIRRPSPVSNQGLNLSVIIITVCGVTILACVIAVIITWAVKRKRFY